jgi:hypothetical protein
LDIIKSSQIDYESARSSLLNIFKPTSSPITLSFAMATGTFYLDCHYIGQAAMPSAERIGWNQTMIVELKANDPTFYDPSGEAYNFVIGAGTDTMLVPTVVPMTIGASTIEASASIINAGTVGVFPTIRVTGPITNCVITNNTTGDKLDFTGVTIAAAHYYDIDLRYGYKTITDNHGDNKIADLTDDSDLVSFDLECDPEVDGGINSFSVTGTSCTANTSVSLQWLTRYIGI